MILELFFLILSIIINSLITYFTGIYDKWYLILIMVILIPITYLLIFGIFILLAGLLSLCVSKKETNKPNKFISFIIKQAFKVILTLSRVRVKITGMENVPSNEKILIVANHRSNFDPFPICYYFKGNIACVTKPENLKMPIYGPLIRKCAYISMPRDDDFAAVKAITRSSKIIKDNNSTVCIFPEGKRNKTDETILDFHSGSFKIATKARCPIAVVSLSNTNNIKSNWPLKRTIVYMDIVKVLKYEDYAEYNTHDLSNYVKGLIETKYKERTDK